MYNLYWSSAPLTRFDNSVPAVSGLYTLTLSGTAKGCFVYYVGKSDKSIHQRAGEHLRSWLTEPDERYWIPVDADRFLNDPVAVFNANAVAQGLSDRDETVRKLRENTSFCYTTPDLDSGHSFANLEYVLQEAVRLHYGIQVKGHIGDAGKRHPPQTDLTIKNTFDDPSFEGVLPTTIQFTASHLRLG